MIWASPVLFPNKDAPRLFVPEHVDGAGHRMKTILEGIAVAYKNNMVFGGALPTGLTETEHGVDFREIVNGFFGAGASKLIFPKVSPNFTAKFDKLKQFELARSSFKDGASYFCPSVQDWELMPAQTSAYWPPALRAAFRDRLLRGRPTAFVRPGRLRVAIHARRGDLSPDNSRVAPDSYFYDLISLVRERFPQADVHLWSSTTKNKAHRKTAFWHTGDFSGYEERNVTIHLDDKNILGPWADFARAHILILSKSSFSMVSGILNTNCVVFDGSLSRPMDGWVDGTEPLNYEARLGDCLSRAAAAAFGAGRLRRSQRPEDARLSPGD